MTRGSPKFFQTLTKTTNDNEDDINMSNLGYGEYKKKSSWSIENITNISTSKFKENMWCDKELEDKRKLRYYKEVVNPNLEDQNYLQVLKSAKKKINIAKIRTNSHELHSESGHWTNPKTPWDERICHHCDTKRVEYEKQFLLDFHAYTHIRSQFKNICHIIDLPNFVSHQNYGDLRTLLSMFFEHRNTILKK
jgi:hypothetical protein